MHMCGGVSSSSMDKGAQCDDTHTRIHPTSISISISIVV